MTLNNKIPHFILWLGAAISVPAIIIIAVLTSIVRKIENKIGENK